MIHSAGILCKVQIIPFIIGSTLLSLIQLYFEWSHKTLTGVFEGSLLDFAKSREVGFNPQVFGWAGYHLWFLGFLFAYSMIALPIFLWLEQDAGQRFIAWPAGLCERRAGLLLFIIPLVLVQLGLRPFYPAEHHSVRVAHQAHQPTPGLVRHETPLATCPGQKLPRLTDALGSFFVALQGSVWRPEDKSRGLAEKRGLQCH